MAETDVREDVAPRALLAELATAIRFLTILPIGGAVVPIGRSAMFFPLVGLGLGGALVLIDRTLAPVLPETLRSVILVATLVVVTGGLHLDGLADTADSVLARDRARALAIMRDPSTGAFGAAAIVLVLLLKVAGLDAQAPGTRGVALLFAPMLARWSIVVLAFGSRPARAEGLGFAMVRSISFREFALASVFALGVTLAYATARGLVAILVLAMVTIGCRVVAHRALHGITGDHLGAVGELNEALVFVVFALGAPPVAAVV